MTRIALITGGASGIGAGLGAALAAAGDRVLLADIDLVGAQRVAQRIGDRATAADLDVTDAEAFQTLVDKTVAEHGRLDLLFNNAGIGIGGDATQLQVAHWDRAIDVNLRGVVHGVCTALPHMVERGDGHIVNTASLAGLIPGPGLAPYAATKHAVVGMTLSLRAELADRGVRFTVLCPGFTDTPILDRSMPEDLPPLEDDVNAREVAASLPGGIYELDRLVGDILNGVNKNQAMVVAPRTAHATWLLMRSSPALMERVMARGAHRQREGS
jgi:NAD(P)-dependent dehydrogenase (short-subunit alcohol dehydrogenase family)